MRTLTSEHQKKERAKMQKNGQPAEPKAKLKQMRQASLRLAELQVLLRESVNKRIEEGFDPKPTLQQFNLQITQLQRFLNGGTVLRDGRILEAVLRLTGQEQLKTEFEAFTRILRDREASLSDLSPATIRLVYDLHEFYAEHGQGLTIETFSQAFASSDLQVETTRVLSWSKEGYLAVADPDCGDRLLTVMTGEEILKELQELRRYGNRELREPIHEMRGHIIGLKKRHNSLQGVADALGIKRSLLSTVNCQDPTRWPSHTVLQDMLDCARRLMRPKTQAPEPPSKKNGQATGLPAPEAAPSVETAKHRFMEALAPLRQRYPRLADIARAIQVPSSSFRKAAGGHVPENTYLRLEAALNQLAHPHDEPRPRPHDNGAAPAFSTPEKVTALDETSQRNILGSLVLGFRGNARALVEWLPHSRVALRPPDKLLIAELILLLLKEAKIDLAILEEACHGQPLGNNSHETLRRLGVLTQATTTKEGRSR